MPSFRHRTRRRAADVAELDSWQEWALTIAGPTGGFLLSGWPEDDPEPWAEAWESHGERLLAEWIEKYPGTRPWPWWVFEHGRERPIVGSMGPEAEASARRDSSYFGLLHSSVLHGYGQPPGVMVPWQEPEHDYLRRHGLLTEAEKSGKNGHMSLQQG